MRWPVGLTRVQDKQIRAAFLARYSIEGWEKPLAITLTLKRALQADGGWVTGNEHHYSGALKHALNVVNHRCFGPRWRSKGHRVKAIAVLETNASGRCHYHLAVDCPAHKTGAWFLDAMKGAWKSTDWGHNEMDFQVADQGWLRYMAKSRSKGDLADAIDWDNLHF
jgi:hypothetical protein